MLPHYPAVWAKYWIVLDPEQTAAERCLIHPSIWRMKLLVTALCTYGTIWHLSLLSSPQGLLLCYKRRPDFSDHTVFWWVLPNTLVSLVQSWELYCPAYGSVILWLLLQLFSFFFLKSFKTFTLFCSGKLVVPYLSLTC